MKQHALWTRLALGITLAAAWLGIVAPADAQTVYRTLQVGAEQRSFYLRVPRSYTGQEAVPLVLMLHGRGGNGQAFERKSGFSQKAEEEGFIIAYPNAIGNPPAWSTGWSGQGGGTPESNVAFLALLIERLEQQYRIDPARIYAGGHSSGGMMSHLLGSVLANKLAAVAPSAAAVGSTRGSTYVEAPPPVAPLSVLLIHGLLDETVPYYGGGGPALDFVPVWYSTWFWMLANGTSWEPTWWFSPDNSLLLNTYTGGANNTEVVLCTIFAGTHEWDSGTDYAMRDLIWQFFVSHPKH